jgi:hypothetical protein
MFGLPLAGGDLGAQTHAQARRSSISESKFRPLSSSGPNSSSYAGAARRDRAGLRLPDQNHLTPHFSSVHRHAP